MRNGSRKSKGKLMSEEETVSVTTEAPEAEVDQPIAQGTEAEVKPDDRHVQAQARQDQAYNWAQARRRQEELERRAANAEAELARLKQGTKPQEEDDLSGLANDDILTVKQAKKLAEKFAREATHEALRQRDASTVDDRLQMKYSDYREVMTPENIDLLTTSDPDFAYSLSQMSDPYAQSVAAYKMLKRMTGDVKKSPQPSVEQKKAQANMQKPISTQAASKTSALGDVRMFENGLTPELRKSLWDEMQTAMKRG